MTILSLYRSARILGHTATASLRFARSMVALLPHLGLVVAS